MKISVLVIAHNEEKHIVRCLSSLTKQSMSPEEIILVAHNCTDHTASIAREFRNVRVVEHFTLEDGPIYARIRGFEETRGDIIACIDGDSKASPRWLEKICAPFQDESVLGVGGIVWFNGLLANMATLGFFFLDPIFRPTFHFYFWGANFAVRALAYKQVGGFEPFLSLRKKLNLYLTPDDAYLSCVLMKVGKIKYVFGARVFSDNNFVDKNNLKEKGKKQNEDRLTLFRYFKLI